MRVPVLTLLLCASAVPALAAADSHSAPQPNLVREGSRWVFAIGVPAYDLEEDEGLLGDDRAFDRALDLSASYLPGVDMITDGTGAHFGFGLNLRYLYVDADGGFESTQYDLSLRYLLGLHWTVGRSTAIHLTSHLGAGIGYLETDFGDDDFTDGFYEFGATLGLLARLGEQSALQAGVEYSAHYENREAVDIEYHWLVPKVGFHLRF